MMEERAVEMAPEEVVEWRATVIPILQRLCELQREVNQRHMGYDEPNDCFCGTGGFWPRSEHFKSSGKTVDFIVEAVREKLDRIAADAPLPWVKP